MIKELGFKFLTNIQIIDDKLSINKNDTLNQIYAIFIEDELVYIGKTKKWKKRWDTYRNCINWVQCQKSNRLKTSLLTEAVLSGKKVEIFYKKCVNSELDNFILIEEEALIKELKPKWNIQHVESK